MWSALILPSTTSLPVFMWRSLSQIAPPSGGAVTASIKRVLRLSNQFQINRDNSRHFLAFEYFICSLNADHTDLFRTLCHSRAHFAAVNGFDTVVGAIKANDQHIRFTGSLQGAQCTERHFVILSEHGLHVLMRSQQILHDVQALGAVEVSRLAGEDL